MSIIYVDLDGTLTKETAGYGNEIYATRTPRPEIVKYVNSLYDKGDTIVIWTARYEVDRTVTMLWLSKHGVKYHRLILDKHKFDLYICDKVRNVGDILREC